MTTSPDIYPDDYVFPERYETEPHDPSPYRYFLADTASGTLIAEVPFIGVTWGLGVSKAGEFAGSIAVVGQDVLPGLDLYAATLPVKTSVFVMRDGETVWGGIVWSRDYSPVTRVLSVSAATFESYLFRRSIWHTITHSNTTDTYTIARDLIDKMQTDFVGVSAPEDHIVAVVGSGDINIEYESRLSGQTPDQTQTWPGGELTTFGDALSTLADNLDGFEWNIRCWFDETTNTFRKKLFFRDTPPGQLPTGILYVGDRPGLEENIFEFPGQVMDVTLSESGDDTATRYVVVGGLPEGVESDYKPRGFWNNEFYLDNGWPLVEVVESSKHANATLESTLDRYAKVYGRRARPLVPTWSVSVDGRLDPAVGTYLPGDWCQLVVHDDFVLSRLTLSGGDPGSPFESGEIVKRITAFSVSVPDVPQEPESVTLELDDEWVDGS